MVKLSDRYPWFKKYEFLWDNFFSQSAFSRPPQSLLWNGQVGLGLVEYAREMAVRWISNPADILWIAPEEGASVIKIEQIRALIDFMCLKTFSGIHRLVVIENAESMNVNAQNALLKILEEPPQNAFIWLISHHPETLLPTIRSRCQQWVFFAEFHEAASYFKQHFPEDSPEALWDGCHFGPLNVSRERQALEKSILNQLKQSVSAIQFAEYYLQKEKKNFDVLCDFFYAWALDWYRFQWGVQLRTFKNEESWFAEYPFCPFRNRKMNDFIKKLTQIKRVKSQGISLNAELMLEDLLIDWKKL